jgi:hypothetical protein
MKREAKFILDKSNLESTYILLRVTCKDVRLIYSTKLKINPGGISGD